MIGSWTDGVPTIRFTGSGLLLFPVAWPKIPAIECGKVEHGNVPPPHESKIKSRAL